MGQNVPVADKDTIIFVTLAVSCDVYNGTTFTISGLTGTQTADNSYLPLSTDKGSLIAATGAWTQASGTLVFTVNTWESTHAPDYYTGHWETGTSGEGTVVVSFTLKNAANGQDFVTPTISGSRYFHPQQFASGIYDGKAPWWASESAPIPEVNLSLPYTELIGVANGTNPLRSVVPALDVALLTQSSPFTGYANTITVSLSPNIDLSNTDGATVTIETFSGPTIGSTLALTEVSGFSGGELGTTGAYSSDTIVYTVASGHTLLASTTYVWTLDITNPDAAQSPLVHFSVATTKVNNDAAGSQTIAFTTLDPLPGTALKGVTNGSNALHNVIPFEVKEFDDSIDTPFAPNVVTIKVQTNIAFVAGDLITITGMLLGTTETVDLALTTVANNATGLWGTTASWNGTSGNVVFTVQDTMVEQTQYSFQFTVTNPAASNPVPTIGLEVNGGTPGALTNVNMTRASSNTDVVTDPFTILDPQFRLLVFTTAVAPGEGSELVFTFTPFDELDTTYANEGVVTIILPGFTGGTDSGLTSTAVTSSPADKFDKASFLRQGETSYLQLTTKTGVTNAYDAEVAVTVPLAMGIKLPADGVEANQANIQMAVGPYSSMAWSFAFSVETVAAVAPLFTGVKVNDLAPKGAASTYSVATIPEFSSVYLEFQELTTVTATILATGDQISLRQGSDAWGCFSTRDASASTSRTGDLSLTLISGSSPISSQVTADFSGINATTPGGTNYSLCYVGQEITAAGVDSETAITFQLQSKVTSVQLNSNGVTTSRILQAPRNDFSVLLFGDNIANTDAVSFIPDAEDCPTQAATALDLTHTSAVTVASSVGSFTWPDCKPTTSGVPIVMDSAQCPTVGFYRLCYNDGTTIETGISAYIQQVTTIEFTAAGHLAEPTFTGTAQQYEAFGADFVHEVFEPFNVTVLLKDSNGAACCEGTKVFISMTKAGVDASSDLYNSDSSNANADKIVLADSSGVATFQNYTIRNTAGKYYYFTVSVADATLTIPSTAAGVANVGFIVRPSKLVQTTALASEYIVGAGGDNAAAVLPSSILVEAQDRYGTVLPGLVTADDFHCEAMLMTAGSGLDSYNGAVASPPDSDYGGVQGAVTSTDLTPSTVQSGSTNVIFNLGVATFSSLKIYKQAGMYFSIKYTLTEHAGTTGAAVVGTPLSTTSDNAAVTSPTSYTTVGFSTSFIVSPARMKIAWGSTPTEYTATTFPFVTRLDGIASTAPSADAPNVDGLPSSLTVTLLDADGATLTSSACTSCLVARLVKCDDSTPANGTLNGNGGTISDGHLLPACIGQAVDAAENDQMAGMSQARCATTGGECVNDYDFAQTLSSSPDTASGTTVAVAAGVASWSGLQARYTFGSGFLLRFVLDPTNSTNENLTSVHTAQNGQIFLPDLGTAHGGSVTGQYSSMLIRPFALEVAQHPGGDGVDLDGLATSVAADGTVNTPDGVGASQPFRVQPAIAVKGMGTSGEYYFTQAWDNHGHLPVTAVIRSDTCGGDCVNKGLILTGTTATGVSLTSLTATARVETGSNDALATYSGSAGTSDVELKYQGVMSKVGFVWEDLKVLTRDSDTGFEGLKLRFVCGYDTDNHQTWVSNTQTTYTAIDSGYFDVFTAPSTPLNLRALSYGELGFRIEFDPGEIARLKPLSGFIVEVDFCSQTSGSCAVQEQTPAWPQIGVPSRRLSSDFYTGGGRVEEVALSYYPTTPAQATEINITMYPKEHIYGGDTIQIGLNLPGLWRAADYSGTCTIEGAIASYFTGVTFDNVTSVLSLTMVDGKQIPRGQPVSMRLPTGCEFIYPSREMSFAAGVNLGANQTQTNLADYQSSRYGSQLLTPLQHVFAYIIGAISSTSGDNCKNVTCTVSSTKVLPSLQDGSSMDVSWSGTQQFGGIGSACYQQIDAPFDTSSTFPYRRFCAMAGTGSNDPDAYDDVADNTGNTHVTTNFGNSGDNGAPIGQNPGRGGKLQVFSPIVSVTTGTTFTDASSSCRAGSNSQNPCVLPVGEGWNEAVTLNYTWTSGNVTAVQVGVTRDRLITPGQVFAVPLSSTVNADGAASSVDCTVTVVSTSEVQAGWTCAWTESSGDGTLTITAGTMIAPSTAVRVQTTDGTLSLTTTAVLPPMALALVNTGTSRVSYIFKNGASAATYTSADGDPVGSYTASSSTITVAADDILSFRVFAYNGRFKSSTAATPVQSRAISKPDDPSYFSEVRQSSVGVQLSYNSTTAGSATDITIQAQFAEDLTNGSYVTLNLPGFSSASIVRDIATGHAQFSSAQWNTNLTSLVLKVAEGETAIALTDYTIVIPSSAGILYPSTGDAPSSIIALIAAYTISWVSPFPLTSKPRKGFVVQTTTDRNWNTDIQTTLFEDKLNNGVSDKIFLDYLQADMADNTTTLAVNDPTQVGPSLDWLVDKFVQIGDEVMRVEGVSGGTLTVRRSRRSTTAVAHPQATGGGTCTCDTAGNATGTADLGQSCACTAVYVSYGQATNPLVGTFKGFDRLIGTAGTNPGRGADGCRIGSIYWPLGCNLRGVAFTSGLRSHQGSLLQAGNRKSNWLSNCGSTGDVCTSGLCNCETPTMMPNMDIGNPVTSDDLVYLRSSGDPLQWSNVPITDVALEINSATVQNVILSDGSDATASYLRIDDELLYVHGGASRGVLAINLYQVTGNADAGSTCACSLTGNSTGGGSCACFPQEVMTGCTEGGTLGTGDTGGGTGFAATFTVANPGPNGYIDSITITDPGHSFISIPDISIATGGTGCTLATYQSFQAITTTHVVQTERGALGTTAVTHSAATKVSKITWPLRDSVNVPGTQYYFRLAAYNDAGLSNYLYFKHSITQPNPTVLSTFGGDTIEITMEGGGVSPANTSVYIGHRHINGSIDFARSKQCGSVVVFDVAGTRITCVTPPWVGARHDLMVLYQSGIIEKLSVANGVMSFYRPEIVAVDPVQVVAGQVASITILGLNFGTNQSDVVGAIRTTTGEKPCEPLVLLSDTSAICNLSVNALIPHTGNLVIGVGTAWSGGQQNTSASGISSQIKEIDPPAEVELTLAVDIATIPEGTPERAAFEANFIADIATAASVPVWRIEIVRILAGSIIVVFVILPDPNSIITITPQAAAAIIAEQAAQPTSALLTGSTTGAVTGVSVAASVLAAAAAATGTTITTTTTPDYKRLTEPKEYTLADMDKCLYECRLLCETGNEVPSVDGFPVLADERPQVCTSECMTHCGYGRPFTPNSLSLASF